MNNFELEKIINNKLKNNIFIDCVPNGLQVEGCKKINSIITGVTACKELLERAVQCKANAILVHHGYFWKNESSVIQGIKRERLKILLSNNINLYSWHYPLDIHPKIGNNAQLGKLLKIKTLGKISSIVFWGELKIPLTGKELNEYITKKLKRKPLHFSNFAPKYIHRVAWCSGAGEKFIENAISINADAFITGEVSEQTFHSAKEYQIHFFSAGHHATECFGIKSLGNWLNKKYKLKIKFINIHNPV